LVGFGSLLCSLAWPLVCFCPLLSIGSGLIKFGYSKKKNMREFWY
jgi:hypothetical protein